MSTHTSLATLSALSFGIALGCGASKNTDNGNQNCLDPSGCDGGSTFDVGGLDTGGDSGFIKQDITLTPTVQTIYIDTNTTPATPASQTYTATLNLDGGGTKDVTPTVALSIDNPT